MNLDGKSALDQSLRLLAALLEEADSPPIGVVICGGAAMLGQGLYQRVTKDVDILAFYNASKGLLTPEPMPSVLVEAAAEVSATLGLPSTWLNNDAKWSEREGVYKKGLPEGLAQRLVPENFGSRLTIYYTSRFDLIHFKLLAACQENRHQKDLSAMNPTAEECYLAAQWVMRVSQSHGVAHLLKRILSEIGHSDVAARI